MFTNQQLDQLRQLLAATEEKVVKRIDEKTQGLEKNVQDLGKKVQGLDEKIQGVEKNVHDLGKKVQGLDKRIHGVEKNVHDLDKKIQGVEKNVHDLGEKVQGLDERMKGVEKNIQNVDKKLEKSIEDQAALFQDLTVQVDKNKKEIIDTLTERMSVALTHHDKRITRVEKHLDLPPLE